MPAKATVLVLAANPKDTPSLRLDQEVREIESGLLRARERILQIRQSWAVRPRDVRRALLEHRPTIVHFCGHGGGEEGLVLEDDHGASQLVSTSALSGLFKLFSTQVHCVVLNACLSDKQAEAIAGHMQYVIGMSRAIEDDAAIEFALGFYDAVAAGEPYDKAFEFGCNAIELGGLRGHLTPVLLRMKPPEISATHDDGAVPTSLGQTRSTARHLTTKSLQTLYESGWSTSAVMKRLEEIDYENVLGLDPESAGAVDQWARIAEANPDGYSFLVDKEGQIVGYWHFEALPSDLYAQAVQGLMEDGQISVDQVNLLCAPGTLDLYFIIFVVEKRYRGFKSNRLLLDAFLARLEELAEAGIRIRRICANAFTPEGVGLCRSMGMEYVRPHQRVGLMFETELTVKNLLLRGRPRLAEMYKRIMEHSAYA